MASRMALQTAFVLRQTSPRTSLTLQRSLSTLSPLPQSSRLRLRRASLLSRPAIQQSFRRTYADAPSVNLSPTPKPKKRFRVFRFIWRVTYLSALGGLAYLTYTIYDAKNPPDQFDPDPRKKTLVILGRSKAPWWLSESPRTNTVQEQDGDRFHC